MFKSLSKKILDTLVKNGVCETGKRYLNTTNKDFNTFVNLWKKWPEYFCEHSDTAIITLRKFLTLDMKKNLISNNLFVDEKGSFTIGSDTSVFFVGNCDLNIQIKDFSVVKIYIFNDSTINIISGYMSCIHIEAYDRSIVNSCPSNTSKVSIRQYDNSKINGGSEIIPSVYKRGDSFNGREYYIEKNY